MRIHVKQHDNLIIPKQGSQQSSGYDVVALDEPNIVGGQDIKGWKFIDYIEYKTGLFYHSTN